MALLILSLAHKSGEAGAYKHGLREVHIGPGHILLEFMSLTAVSPQFPPTVKDLPRDRHSVRLCKGLATTS